MIRIVRGGESVYLGSLKLASACQSVSSGSSVSFPFSVVGAAPSGLSAVPVVTQSSVQLFSGGGLDLSRSSVKF